MQLKGQDEKGEVDTRKFSSVHVILYLTQSLYLVPPERKHQQSTMSGYVSKVKRLSEKEISNQFHLPIIVAAKKVSRHVSISLPPNRSD